MSFSVDDTTNPWSLEEVHQLRRLIQEKAPPHVISVKLRRSEDEIYAKALELGIVLKATAESSSEQA
jgi:hypothetical protein